MENRIVKRQWKPNKKVLLIGFCRQQINNQIVPMSATTDIIEYSNHYSHGGSKKVATQKIRLYIEDQILSQKRFPISIFPWLKISQFKKEIQNSRMIRNATQYNLRLFYKNIQLANGSQNVMDFNLEKDSVIVAQINDQQSLVAGFLNPYRLFQTVPSQVTEHMMAVVDGLQGGSRPKLTSEGTSGTYILENSKNQKVAIFKPYDQEPYAPNNPRNYIGKLGSEGIRKGILSGQNATREVAAYILSAHTKSINSKKVSLTDNYHGVPVTTYVQFYHPSFSKNNTQTMKCHPITCSTERQLGREKQFTKHGSLQEFVQFQDVAGNFSSNLFTLQEVHKIAILDLRILNCDRNEANIGVIKLAKKGQTGKANVFYQLIPIDHGLSFPDNFQIHEHEITWMDYPQVKKPFTDAELQFIAKIDPEDDAKKLREKLGFRPICLRNFQVAEIFLKKAAKAGLTLHQIGKLVYRKSNEFDDSEQEQQAPKTKKNHRSELEQLVIQAQNLYSLIQQTKCNIREPLEQHLSRIKHNEEQKNDPQQHEQETAHEQIHEEEHQHSISISDEESFQIEDDEDGILHEKAEQNAVADGSPTLDSSISTSQQISELILDVIKTHSQHQSDTLAMTNIEISSGRQKQNQGAVRNPRRILTSQPESKQQGKKKKRNISLPHLKKRTTSYRQSKYQQRRKREGPNGVSKPHQSKRYQSDDQWGPLFFHYFEELVDTFFVDKQGSTPNKFKHW